MSRNVTFVEDLPDVEYIDDYNTHSKSNHQVDKYLRKSHTPPVESGMSHGSTRYSSESRMDYVDTTSPPPSMNNVVTASPDDKRLHCIEVLKHLENCPICAKYYGKNDNMPYMIIIGILSVLCLMLIKKVLDSYGENRYSRRFNN